MLVPRSKADAVVAVSEVGAVDYDEPKTNVPRRGSRFGVEHPASLIVAGKSPGRGSRLELGRRACRNPRVFGRDPELYGESGRNSGDPGSLDPEIAIEPLASFPCRRGALHNSLAGRGAGRL